MGMLYALSTALLAADEETLAIVFGVGGTVAVFGIVTYQWRRAKEAAYNARLKQMMIERGMSADEIERVIHAEDARRRNRCDIS